MHDEQMQGLIDAGEAVRLGELPGSPVLLGDHYWRPAKESDWEIIEDPALIAYLADARRRLELADAAIAASGPSR